ncbi:hypothetical protein K488DRAFT_28312, partial [Vararia minispora EC-137]
CAGEASSRNSKFLKGDGAYKVAHILPLWYKSPEGSSDSPSELFNLNIDYTKLESAKATLTSFAAQIVLEKMRLERNHAVHPRGRLKENQPLTWSFIYMLASPQQTGNVIAVRSKRPQKYVMVNCLSLINFSSRQSARLVPAGRSVFWFTTGAQQKIFRAGSREGLSLSYTATYQMLAGLASVELEALAELGRSHTSAPVFHTDNVQLRLKRRDLRSWREDGALIGIAGTAVEMIGFNADALDLNKKLIYRSQSKRAELTVYNFLDLLDEDHLERVCTLQFLQTLVTYIPELKTLQSQIDTLRHTSASELDGGIAQLRLSPQKSKVRPAATSAKDEGKTAELAAALDDFLSQMGQKPGDYIRRLVLVGGDGLTYEKVVNLQEVMQLSEDPLENKALLQPFLQIWHTEWTDQSRIYGVHWDDLLTHDPSKISHSAGKMPRKAPFAHGKVDYYAATDLAYLILDTRILDCWRIYFETDNLWSYFSQAAEQGSLPTFESLYASARTLHRRHSSLNAYHRLMTGDFANEPEEFKPVLAKNTQAGNSCWRDSSFCGDMVLAHSGRCIHDLMLSREVATAEAEGDPGRIYEILKIWLFTFAGSSHSKYTTYLLEFICDLEWESSPELAAIIKKNLLCNLRGHANSWQAGDIMQEHNNRDLVTILEHAGQEWDAHFARRVISPNIARMAEIKKAWGEGLGLEVPSGQHTSPHTRAEVRRLMEAYKVSELHCFCPGRAF